MNPRILLTSLTVPLALLAACGGEPETAAATGSSSPTLQAPAVPNPVGQIPAAQLEALADFEPAADAPVHAVACGCALEEVGHCSEWIEVDGEYVALELPVDLGSMPFCKIDGLKARVEGGVEDETFVATAFAYAD